MGINMMSLVLGAAIMYIAEHWLNLPIPSIPNPLAGLTGGGKGSKFAQSYYGYY